MEMVVVTAAVVVAGIEKIEVMISWEECRGIIQKVHSGILQRVGVGSSAGVSAGELGVVR